MDLPPSPFETIAASLAGIWRGLLLGLGAWGIAPQIALPTHRWVSDKILRFNALLARYRAGTLRRVTWRVAPMPTARKTHTTPAARLPRRFGWLVALGKHNAACCGTQLQAVLETPEMAELLEASPQAQRILRPLLRALAVPMPCVIDAPRAPRKPRIRKARPKPEAFQIPLPRGVLTWSRRERALEKAIAALR